MKIGLISDTHLPGAMKEPPPQVVTAFRGVDLILHAGNILLPSFLDWLEKIAPVQATEEQVGRMWNDDKRMGPPRILNLDGYAIGLVHDLTLPGTSKEPVPGAIQSEFPESRSLPAVLQEFFGGKVDIVVHGATYQEAVEWHQGVLLINPGSATMPRQVRKLGTVVILDLTPQGPTARIVNLAEL